MSANEREKIADIVAEFREMVHKSVDGIIAVKADVIADRIEAAWNREHGNTAAMREALEEIVGIVSEWQGSIPLGKVCKIAKAAISEPPRNCDRFGGDEVKVFDCYIQERKVCEYKHLFPDYGFWLLKTAKTEGGAK